MTRYVVVGGGILGLATAYRLLRERPGASVTVLEKEDRWAAHQTGHNSGVLHAGVYYPPGSLKAEFCRRGRESMVEFCREYGVPHRICGKLVVATSDAEVPRLRALHERSLANGLAVRMITPAEAREYEPEVACVAAMHVPETGIADFAAVCTSLAGLLTESGADLRLGTRVTGIRGPVVETERGEFPADVLVNCAGLHADRVARLAGVEPPARIVPFRGEYHELRPEARHLVRGLVYPVPDPRFPFLGVHLTRMVDGSVHAGPNAVLALSREGYSWGRIRLGDVVEAATYPGLWRLGLRHHRYGAGEVLRSLSTRRLVSSLARLVPAITAADVVPAGAGVRAQAVRPNGDLVDDFLIERRDGQVHVLNAPSPAATSAFEIARHVLGQLPM
ncbi:MAG TPA: L-2-hydroxyglutarate oxidase [Mycobacteriales bacterium]|nr:L-2-hydroxyglutarate oxidase [Mycobacteriales bacterium]